jgi:hypothetical protein
MIAFAADKAGKDGWKEMVGGHKKISFPLDLGGGLPDIIFPSPIVSLRPPGRNHRIDKGYFCESKTTDRSETGSPHQNLIMNACSFISFNPYLGGETCMGAKK